MHKIDEKKIEILHPITSRSGLFCGMQMSCAAFTEEAYAMYMSLKKLAYFLEDSTVTLQSDHLLLRKILEKNILKLKVNNWELDISPFKIKPEYIKGIKNTLAHNLSRLIKINQNIQLDPVPEAYESGYYVLTLSDISTVPRQEVAVNTLDNAISMQYTIRLASPIQK